MINYSKLKKEYDELAEKLAVADVYNNRQNYQIITRRFSLLGKLIGKIKEQHKAQQSANDLMVVINNSSEDEEIKQIANEELVSIEDKVKRLEDDIDEIVFSGRGVSYGSIIIEIRAAAGGDEAALFARDLFKMYSKYIEKRSWKLEILTSHYIPMGGIKEIVFAVSGQGCFSYLNLESGVHRVQRVPVTESGGRIHTSTATVAVLIEPKIEELKINPQDLKIDIFRSSGPGGQHVNKTSSAIRITHLPSGIVVICQDERSQTKNKTKAMRVLKARILDKIDKEKQAKLSYKRKVQIGSGDRSEKIRTYNFSEGRVTDHRINLTVYRLEEIMEGNLDYILKPLMSEAKKKIYEVEGLG